MSYASFSPELRRGRAKFFDERGSTRRCAREATGAFCAYTVPTHPPVRVAQLDAGGAADVLTLAHELGHGLHAYLARPQGVFHQRHAADAGRDRVGVRRDGDVRAAARTGPIRRRRLALLARTSKARSRRCSADRDEPVRDADAHRPARKGELAIDASASSGRQTQTAMLGDSVELTEGYLTWWSYIPHFIATPGYVYAYAYGYLFSLAIYRRYVEEGEELVEPILDLLRAGGSAPPVELARRIWKLRRRGGNPRLLVRGHLEAISVLVGARLRRGARRRDVLLVASGAMPRTRAPAPEDRAATAAAARDSDGRPARRGVAASLRPALLALAPARSLAGAPSAAAGRRRPRDLARGHVDARGGAPDVLVHRRLGDRLGHAARATVTSSPRSPSVLFIFVPFPLLISLFVLPGLGWLALVGLAVPAVVIEGRGFRDALRRGIELARADYVHALGSLC